MSATLSPLFTWRGAICDSAVSPTGRHVALTLSLHMSERGDSCFPSLTTLERETGRARTTVTAALKELEENGWLVVDHGAKGRANRYRATLPEGSSVTLPPPSSTTLPPSSVTLPEVVKEDVKDQEQDQTLSPPKASKEEKDAIWEALEAVFGKPTTPQHRSRFGRVQKELLADSSLTADLVPAEIQIRSDRYRGKWPDADLTLEALAKHWPDLREGNGNGRMTLSKRLAAMSAET